MADTCASSEKLQLDWHDSIESQTFKAGVEKHTRKSLE